MPPKPIGQVCHGCATPCVTRMSCSDKSLLSCHPVDGTERLAYCLGVCPVYTPCAYGHLTLTLAPYWRAFYLQFCTGFRSSETPLTVPNWHTDQGSPIRFKATPPSNRTGWGGESPRVRLRWRDVVARHQHPGGSQWPVERSFACWLWGALLPAKNSVAKELHLGYTTVVAGFQPASEGGILPPGPTRPLL